MSKLHNNFETAFLKGFLTRKDDVDENRITEQHSGGASNVTRSVNCSQARRERHLTLISTLKTLDSEYQINQLQIKFNEKKYLSMAERAEIAITLNITQNQVKIWFQVSFCPFFLKPIRILRTKEQRKKDVMLLKRQKMVDPECPGQRHFMYISHQHMSRQNMIRLQKWLDMNLQFRLQVS